MSDADVTQAAIEAEVEHARAQLQASVDELAHRLSPREAAQRHRGTLVAAGAAAAAVLAAIAVLRRVRARRDRTVR